LPVRPASAKVLALRNTVQTMDNGRVWRVTEPLQRAMRLISRPMLVSRRARAATPVGADPCFRNEDTFLLLGETARDARFDMAFRKTYAHPCDYIDADHRYLAECPTRDGMIDIGIEGWLLPADALKLYEMVYFCGGDVLELGTYRGLSASVALNASVNSGRIDTIISIDLDPGAAGAGRATLDTRPGVERVFFFNTSGDEALCTFIKAKRRFRFCFIDHSHRYEHVRSAATLLPEILEPGAFFLWHDYNDPRNSMIECEDYGVYQGVRDGLDATKFEFWGIFGCTGLFRYRP
jgi:hypothetical protein